MEKNIVISERDNIAAVLENSRVMEFFIHRGEMLLGDIYLGVVENILPSIDAAFINLGSEKMGFLHASDVPGKVSLKGLLKPKQKLIVQIMKEPTGHKGARVSTQISMPGRFLVFMPESKGISVSRKIVSAVERGRLKSIVSLLKPPGVGIIIRTEAENQAETEIQEDLESLIEKWNYALTMSESVTPPSLLYRDQDLLYRVIRESCTDDVSQIHIDTAFGQNRVNQLIQAWNLGNNIKVNVHKGKDSIIMAHNIDKDIKNALGSRVELPSGGYIYIQATEALTVIDINSGRFTSSQSQSETIRLTNLEAAHEIARQLRLRNIGGMIVVDFIDMESRADQLFIMEEFEKALTPDKAKPQIGQLSDLGLVELTRHRQGQSLIEIFTKKCPACSGEGVIIEEFNFAPAYGNADFRPGAVKMASRKLEASISPLSSRVRTNLRQESAAIRKLRVEQDTKLRDVLKQLSVKKTDGPLKNTLDFNENTLNDALKAKEFTPILSKALNIAPTPPSVAKKMFRSELSSVLTMVKMMEESFYRSSEGISRFDYAPDVEEAIDYDTDDEYTPDEPPYEEDQDAEQTNTKTSQAKTKTKSSVSETLDDGYVSSDDVFSDEEIPDIDEEVISMEELEPAIDEEDDQLTLEIDSDEEEGNPLEGNNKPTTNTKSKPGHRRNNIRTRNRS